MAEVITEFRINERGLALLKRVDIAQWVQTDILEEARRTALDLVHVDNSDLKNSIGTALEQASDGTPVGFLFAGTDYAIWQELEPGDRSEYLPVKMETSIVRKRTGGKAFLRPAMLRALQPFTT